MPSRRSILRHERSAGGYVREGGWRVLSWYDEMHKLTPAEMVTVGVGMCMSQHVVWKMLSMAAYRECVFPQEYFDHSQVLIADVTNNAIWYLLHQITRPTYQSLLDKGMTLGWEFVAADLHAGVWELVMDRANHPSLVIHTLWRGNNLFEACAQHLERAKVTGDAEDILSLEQHDMLIGKLRAVPKSSSTSCVGAVEERLRQFDRIVDALLPLFEEVRSDSKSISISKDERAHDLRGLTDSGTQTSFTNADSGIQTTHPNGQHLYIDNISAILKTEAVNLDRREEELVAARIGLEKEKAAFEAEKKTHAVSVDEAGRLADDDFEAVWQASAKMKLSLGVGLFFRPVAVEGGVEFELTPAMPPHLAGIEEAE